MTRHARIEIVPADVLGGGWADSPHFLGLRSPNGSILAHSETYSSKSKARRATWSWMRAMSDVLTGWDEGDSVHEVES